MQSWEDRQGAGSCGEACRGRQPKGPCTRHPPLPAAPGQEVLQAIRNYVHFFFGCRDCADHFEQMAAGSMHKVRSPNEAVLWLWSGHNRVNARLAGKARPPPGLQSSVVWKQVLQDVGPETGDSLPPW